MPISQQKILIVDDEPAQRQLLTAALNRDYHVVAASNGQEATQLLNTRSYDLVITDERMPLMGGLELIRWIREREPDLPILVLTAYGSVETAVEAIKLGAQEYLTKPLKSPEELRLMVAKTMRQRMIRDQNLLHQAETDTQFPPDIVAESESIKRVLGLAAQVAAQSTTVLQTGESGTGKEVVARFIHRGSPRSQQAFVAVNCAALSETLLESELFGHEKGAFTGAVQAKRGRFELAQGGTFFLDEIAETGLPLQAKLLRVLQEQQFERVGGIRTLSVDVRIIAATNKNLAQAIAEKSFREDLFYRLNVFPINIPPLRERREDVLPLAGHFAKKISVRMGRSFSAFSAEASRSLLQHPWPGNVRELQNAVERALIVAKSSVIQAEDLPFFQGPAEMVKPDLTTLAAMEKAMILDGLNRCQGDRRATAEQLGISLRTLQYRLKEYGLTSKEAKETN
jgi:DNA-binding NtrC family response regulator